MKTSVFVGVSVDGFLARASGGLDFLDAAGSGSHGYEEFIESVDTIVIGGKTFEIVMGFDAWPYGQRRVVVLSSQPVDLSGATARGGRIEQMSGPPSDSASTLAAQGARHAYVDGGVTIQRFLRAGLIQRLVISRVPVLIGSGIPLFGALPHDVSLRHVATKAFAGGLVQSEYAVVAA